MLVLVAVIAAFVTARLIHLEPATVAMLGAAALLDGGLLRSPRRKAE